MFKRTDLRQKGIVSKDAERANQLIDSLLKNLEFKKPFVEDFIRDEFIQLTISGKRLWTSKYMNGSNDTAYKKVFMSMKDYNRVSISITGNNLSISFRSISADYNRQCLIENPNFEALSKDQRYLLFLSKMIVNQIYQISSSEFEIKPEIKSQTNKQVKPIVSKTKDDNKKKKEKNNKQKTEEETISQVVSLTDNNTIHWKLKRITQQKIQFASDNYPYWFGIKEKGNVFYVYFNNIRDDYPGSDLSDRYICVKNTEKAQLLLKLLNSVEKQTQQLHFTVANKPRNKQINNIDINTSGKQSISFNDFIVYSKDLSCRIKGHHIENVLSSVEVMAHTGEIKLMQIQAAYCKKCGVYYITQKDYETLIRIGTPLCKIMSRDVFYKHGKIVYKNKNKSEYVLSEYGYNVQANNDMNQHERHVKLKTLVDYHILTISEIKAKISSFIKQKEGLKNYLKAVEKWNNDYEYLGRLHSEMKTQKIERIKVTNYYPNEKAKRKTKN
ncbi:MAG: hypothetical protein IJK00_00290 [Clostridia bacterium]|nr:hypothetical protein [Clostridia bacterium]